MKTKLSLDRFDRVEELGEAPEVGLRLLRGRHGGSSASCQWSRYFRFLRSMQSRFVAHFIRHDTPALHYTCLSWRLSSKILYFNFGTYISFVRSSALLMVYDGFCPSVCRSALLCSALPPVASSPFLQSRMHVLEEREPVEQGWHAPILFKIQEKVEGL